jgi:hypothetical protein
VFFLQDPRLSIPRNNKHRPRGTTQDALGNRSLPESLPPSSPVGTKNHDVDLPGVCVKHDDPGGISVLLFNADLYACRLCPFPMVSQVFEPHARARGESNVRRGCVKKEQFGVPDHCEAERTIKCSFARLLEIYCAENPREGPHAIPHGDQIRTEDFREAHGWRRPRASLAPSATVFWRRPCPTVSTSAEHSAASLAEQGNATALQVQKLA